VINFGNHEKEKGKTAGLGRASLYILGQHMAYMQLKQNFCALITLPVWQ